MTVFGVAPYIFQMGHEHFSDTSCLTYKDEIIITSWEKLCFLQWLLSYQLLRRILICLVFDNTRMFCKWTSIYLCSLYESISGDLWKDSPHLERLPFKMSHFKIVLLLNWHIDCCHWNILGHFPSQITAISKLVIWPWKVILSARLVSIILKYTYHCWTKHFVVSWNGYVVSLCFILVKHSVLWKCDFLHWGEWLADFP